MKAEEAKSFDSMAMDREVDELQELHIDTHRQHEAGQQVGVPIPNRVDSSTKMSDGQHNAPTNGKQLTSEKVNGDKSNKVTIAPSF